MNEFFFCLVLSLFVDLYGSARDKKEIHSKDLNARTWKELLVALGSDVASIGVAPLLRIWMRLVLVFLHQLKINSTFYWTLNCFHDLLHAIYHSSQHSNKFVLPNNINICWSALILFIEEEPAKKQARINKCWTFQWQTKSKLVHERRIRNVKFFPEPRSCSNFQTGGWWRS